MRKTKLEWYENRGVWYADAGPFELRAFGRGVNAGGEWTWVVDHGNGAEKIDTADSLKAAQLAAEAAALQWLTEGVTALGGRVLDRDEVAHHEALMELARYELRRLLVIYFEGDEDVHSYREGARIAWRRSQKHHDNQSVTLRRRATMAGGWWDWPRSAFGESRICAGRFLPTEEWLKELEADHG